ncbi:hypothetical protein J2Z31_001775 [Sinorhizobium kostiense]|uniref:Uncharacterized protein n=1 Tax=Sinorhizobium kostiense TaxID=76747 RepID=A0ABS4QXB6_9HYPH|nr:hypothetical protein [Sinorhizobium kostiense]MBP2235283.1 hypothetical protein [Sinorhizobium kostiense]
MRFFLILAFAITMYTFVEAAEQLPFRSMSLDYNLQIDDYSWDSLKNKYTLFRHKFNNAFVISLQSVEGEELLVVVSGGGFISGCDVDGRFSMFSPMFRLGGRHSDVIKCSNPAKPGEKGTIKYSSSSSFNGNVLTLRSQMSEVRRYPGMEGTVLGQDALDKIEIQVKFENGRCKVLKAFYAGERKNFGLKGYAKASSKSSKPNCKIHM